MAGYENSKEKFKNITFTSKELVPINYSPNKKAGIDILVNENCGACIKTDFTLNKNSVDEYKSSIEYKVDKIISNFYSLEKSCNDRKEYLKKAVNLYSDLRKEAREKFSFFDELYDESNSINFDYATFAKKLRNRIEFQNGAGTFEQANFVDRNFKLFKKLVLEVSNFENTLFDLCEYISTNAATSSKIPQYIISFDDKLNSAREGVLRAIRKYDPQKVKFFIGYAGTAARNRIIDQLRLVRDEDAVEFDESINYHLTSKSTKRTDPEIVFEKKELSNLLNNLISGLGEKEQLLIEHFFGLNNKEKKSDEEMAEIFGIKKGSVSVMRGRAYAKLRNTVSRKKMWGTLRQYIKNRQY